MNFENFYKNVEKIKYLNYEIDDSWNLFILSKFQHFLDLSLKYKLNLSVTGTIACIFHTNKLFRTIGDIDLILDYQDFQNWIEIFNQENYKLLCYNVNPEKFDMIKFIKDSINQKKPLTLKNYDNNSTVDLIFDKSVEDKFFFKTINNYKIIYRLAYKYRNIKNNKYLYNRKKDFDDIDFYYKFFKYPIDFII